MVSSLINSQVEYKETRTVDPEDIGHQTAIYELDVFDKPMIIAIGKPKYTFSNKKIVFYPIYAVNQKNLIYAQIGVFEVCQDDALKIIDEDGDVDIDKVGAPILYGFAEKITKTHVMKIDDYLHQWNKTDNSLVREIDDVKRDDAEVDIEIEFDDSDDDIFKLGVPTGVISKEKNNIKKTLMKGVFDTNTTMLAPITLVEETEESVISSKGEYRESPSHTWIQKYMKNDNYKIHDVESNGDCFFAVVRDAFAQIGEITTVAKLRAIIADEVSDSVFQEHRQVFLDIDGNIKRNTIEMKKIKSTISPGLKRRAKLAEKKGSKDELKAIISEGNIVMEKYKGLGAEIKTLTSLLSDSVGNLMDIDTLEKFRRFIQTSNYWANELSISILEQKLKIKMIIMSEDSFSSKDLTGVLMCNTGNIHIEENMKTSPEYYIITSLKRRHYSLISYKNKGILTFAEIPYQIKTLIVNKCMEMNSGAFHLIQDFRNLKSRMGIDPSLGDNSVEDDNFDGNYESDVVLMFYSKSNKTPQPGRGSGESILPKNILDMSGLSNPENDDWRRKLSDSWCGANFNIGGRAYASVEHYYESSKFKGGFPDFALKFSLDSGSDISKDVTLAKAAGSISGILKNKGKNIPMRAVNITPDPEFFPNTAKESRLEAVRAKFSQNQDMKNILLFTKNAKLTRYIINQPAEVDDVLMKIRKELIVATPP